MRRTAIARNILLALAASLLVTPWSSAAWLVIPHPRATTRLMILDGRKTVLNLDLAGWGPKWRWVGPSGARRQPGNLLALDAPFAIDPDPGKAVVVTRDVQQAGPRGLALRYEVRSRADVPITLLAATLAVDKGQRGRMVLVHEDGSQTTVNLPVGARGIGKPVASASLLLDGAGGGIGITFDPPCPVTFDGALRVLLAQDVVREGSRALVMTLSTPGAIELVGTRERMREYARSVAGPGWFPFAPTGKLRPGTIGMEDWLERPAGGHGGVRMVDDRFQFEDGTPVKFWGTNLSYGGMCAPEKAVADFTAARFARYGINGVRLHKFSYDKNQMGIGDPRDATRMDPAGLDRLDYFSAQLKGRGIYFGWSHTFGLHVRPGNRSRLAAYDEIAAKLKGNTYALINFAEDVQDLMIEMVVNLLRHRNPYTGRTYAEEPALSFIELQNEDDIFFFSSTQAFNACPTYRDLFIKRFSGWLADRYRTEGALKEAWGGSLKAGEGLSARNIVPEVNPWFFSDANLPNQRGGMRRRLLDTAGFLHECQNRFYSRFVRAIREAGYEGPICGSPWQAPTMLPHYANLRSDALAGYIDRHNYFGGRIGDSMLRAPGSGYLSTGLQQVAGRPFGLSEWIHVFPSLYAAEGPAIVAAYGMGLQGWDASYEFQSQATRRAFSDRVGWLPWGVWDADTPTQVGQYPSLARMVLRGDVKEGPVISTRRVSPADLERGEFSFADQASQQGDVKTFGGSVPREALAAGRVLVEFTPESRPSTFADLARFREGSTIVSATGQLRWGEGFFTIDTAATKAVVGFAEGKPQALGGVEMTLGCPYASLVLTALGRAETLDDARRALLTAMARSSNADLSYFVPTGELIEAGRPPALLEPVKATITLSARKPARVHILDHDGHRTGKTVPVTDGRFTIDGARDRTPYYEVEF